jgi:hypothetical protein
MQKSEVPGYEQRSPHAAEARAEAASKSVMRMAVEAALSRAGLPFAELPVDTRIDIHGCPRANYVGFYHSGLRGFRVRHSIRFDELGLLTLPASRKEKEWQNQIIISDETRAVDNYLLYLIL